MNIIDPHFHCWDLENLRYPWLMGPSAGGLLGDYRSICLNYLLENYFEDIRSLNVVKAVHIESAAQPEDSLAETQWLQAMAERPESRGFPHGIVFFADLSASDVDRQLDRHCRFTNVRGIRQMLNRHKGVSFDVPGLGKKTFLKDNVIIAGDLITFTKENIDNYNF
jgi:predicted TIM-barrel fold metal-dependent hydrolase